MSAAPNAPSLVATDVTYCTTHAAIDHDDGRAWTACRFRQLFYFDDPADEDALTWSDLTEPVPLFRYWSVLVILAGLASGKGWGITDTGWAVFTADWSGAS